MRCSVKKSQIFSILGAFALGSVSTFLVMNSSQNAVAYEKVTKDEDIKLDRVTNSLSGQDSSSDRIIQNRFQDRRDAFAQMDRMREQMRKQMDQMMAGAFSDHDAGGLGQSGIEVASDEDSQYKYLKISGEGVDKDTLDIQIKNGMISISGKVEKRSGDGQGSSSTYISQFSQSFNVPNGVDEKDVEMETENDTLILKFKKS